MSLIAFGYAISFRPPDSWQNEPMTSGQRDAIIRAQQSEGLLMDYWRIVCSMVLDSLGHPLGDKWTPTKFQASLLVEFWSKASKSQKAEAKRALMGRLFPDQPRGKA